jgi:hypothetical protein
MDKLQDSMLADSHLHITFASSADVSGGELVASSNERAELTGSSSIRDRERTEYHPSRNIGSGFHEEERTRGRSRERSRSRGGSRDRSRDGSRDRSIGRSRDRSRDISREIPKDRSRDERRDFVKVTSNSDDDSTRHLWVGNLGDGVTSADLEREFGRFGDMENISHLPSIHD